MVVTDERQTKQATRSVWTSARGRSFEAHRSVAPSCAGDEAAAMVGRTPLRQNAGVMPPEADPSPLAAPSPAPTLGAVHARRLREVWRSAGWPCQDLVEVELLAAGLLERVRHA